MAGKKKAAVKTTETENEPGFFSDYGYGGGTAITMHNPPLKPKDSKAIKSVKSTKIKRK